MNIKLPALAIATLSGVTMALQGSVNSVLGKIIGLLEATFIVHAVGLALVSALLFVFHLGDGNWQRIAEAPWYAYLGGVLGVAILYGVVRTIPVLGVAAATTAIIVGQVLTAALVDHLGLFGLEKMSFNWYRVAGTVLMASGAFLLLKK
jgi:transporter family-2 protein